jgi:2-polyprenyl-3-methyl-5-hydroxy-6-metoxy-1,4-benzoquinol methylase
MKGSTDLAGSAYWDDLWRRDGNRGLGRFSYFHTAFARVLGAHLRPGMRVCEVGCADSVWVPLLAARGYDVTGLDYSESGVARLRERLQAQHLDARVVCGDLFADSLEPGGFDVVFTLGLIEHFTDVGAVLERLRRLLKPGGVLITIVPNLAGVWGALQRRVDKEIYEVHVPYTVEMLDRVHRAAKLDPVSPPHYFGIFGPLILNSGALRRNWPRVNRACQGVLWITQQGVSWPLALIAGERANGRAFSSHIVGVYRAHV